MASEKNFSTEFGRRLQTMREQRGLTQTALGQRAKMAPAAISHFETAQRIPSLESFAKLVDALDVSADSLLGRANLDTSGNVDPIFLRASSANARTLDTVRRVTAAILDGNEREKRIG
jgi:transcriptional regulator with XRE-family HTH domain